MSGFLYSARLLTGEPGHDVDLVAEFDEAKTPSLIDLVRLENRFSDLLGCKVDLVLGCKVDLARSAHLKPRVRKNVEREAVLPFNDPQQCFTMTISIPAPSSKQVRKYIRRQPV